MNDLFHQMFLTRMSSRVASRLQVKEQIKKRMNTRTQMWMMNFERVLQASGNLA